MSGRYKTQDDHFFVWSSCVWYLEIRRVLKDVVRICFIQKIVP